MRNKYNNLLKYLYDYSGKEQRIETVNDLFRSALEPVIQTPKAEACVLLRIFDREEKKSILKRLFASNIQVYNFGEYLSEYNLNSCRAENIWEETEFVIILSSRYSSALIWDYSSSEVKNYTKVCLLYNSKIISEIAKLIADNSKEPAKSGLTEIVKKYTPDRRENMLMNKSIQAIAARLNDKNEEFMFSEYEKSRLNKDEETLKTAEIISNKAKFTAHEIKNYLSIINLYSKIAEKKIENIKADKEITESVMNALNNITSASENISYLISGLRCLSAPEKSEMSIELLIKPAVSLCTGRINTAGAEIKELNIKDGIVNADKSGIQCAVINLIFNALDAGARNIYIDADESRIIIKNDGALIPDEIKEKIFDENFTTKESGTGLGLAFCRRHLRNSGGDIILVSSDRRETIFKIKY